MIDELKARGRHKVVLGMVHLRPLPGTPFYREDSFAETLDRAVRSACALYEGGADGCLVQTVDRVYSVKDESDPARTAAAALIVRSIVEAAGEGFYVGVQLMRNAVRDSLAVAKVAGGAFIRAGAVVGRTLSADGMVEAAPLSVAEYRDKIRAWDVGVIADVASMHFSWPEAGTSVADVAKKAQAVGADAVAIGHPDEEQTLRRIAEVRRGRPDLPIVLAGYTDHRNVARLMAAADGAFVGSCLETGGWGGEVAPELVREYVDVVRGLEV